jgi:Peptidase family M23
MSKICKPFEGSYPITSNFGTRKMSGRTEYHDGIDFALPLGTKIYNIDAGIVTFAGADQFGGLFVDVKALSDNWTCRYLHLSQIFVAKGQKIQTSQEIGLSGNTGLSTGPHLHLGLFNTQMIAQNPNVLFSLWKEPAFVKRVEETNVQKLENNQNNEDIMFKNKFLEAIENDKNLDPDSRRAWRDAVNGEDFGYIVNNFATTNIDAHNQRMEKETFKNREEEKRVRLVNIGTNLANTVEVLGENLEQKENIKNRFWDENNEDAKFGQEFCEIILKENQKKENKIKDLETKNIKIEESLEKKELEDAKKETTKAELEPIPKEKFSFLKAFKGLEKTGSFSAVLISCISVLLAFVVENEPLIKQLIPPNWVVNFGAVVSIFAMVLKTFSSLLENKESSKEESAIRESLIAQKEKPISN